MKILDAGTVQGQGTYTTVVGEEASGVRIVALAIGSVLASAAAVVRPLGLTGKMFWFYAQGFVTQV